MKYTPKNQLKVEGKMTTRDAGIVGKRLALAAIIASAGALMAGVAALIAALK